VKRGNILAFLALLALQTEISQTIKMQPDGLLVRTNLWTFECGIIT